MTAVETDAHVQLKEMALGFMRSQGCRALATEVSCPIARYRVDAAGWVDRRRPADPWTMVIECKQTRADFLRDRAEADRLLAERESLDQLARRIEEHRIKTHEPHLRQGGTALFPELEVWDFSASRLPGYRRLQRRIRDVERRLYGQTKFFTIARYRLADRLYLAAPRGLITRRELPRGWGLLECPLRALEAARAGGWRRFALEVAVEAPPLTARQDFRVRMLRNIAVAASRTVPSRVAASW